jgi:hypothetical protein
MIRAATRNSFDLKDELIAAPVPFRAKGRFVLDLTFMVSPFVFLFFDTGMKVTKNHAGGK